jgi:hypothetical protein
VELAEDVLEVVFHGVLADDQARASLDRLQQLVGRVMDGEHHRSHGGIPHTGPEGSESGYLVHQPVQALDLVSVCTRADNRS